MPVRLPMVWLFILAFFILVWIPPKFRIHGLGLFLLLALIGFLLSQPEEDTVAKARDLIPLAQVEMSSLELQRSHGVGYELRGEVANRSSAYRLTGLGLQLAVKDCVGGEEDSPPVCTLLEEIRTHLSLSVPSQEVREFKKRLYFPELHLQGRLQWEITLRYTEAQEPGGLWERIYPRR